jgi:DNA-binding LytR/AlgR family response regulator
MLILFSWVESYELNAVDYLLKPFSFERFTKAVYKALDVIAHPNKTSYGNASERKDAFFIKSDGKTYPVFMDDILYCEARKNYTMVVLKNDKKLMPLIPLSKFETVLSEAGGEFIQVHRSFLVARKHISAVTANNVIINKTEVPIGIQYKENFFKAIGMKNTD